MDIEKRRKEIEKFTREIVLLQSHIKALTIYAEEFDLDLDTFAQPALEQVRGFDHYFRALGAQTGVWSEEITGADKDEYILTNLKACHAHAFRAFFDVSDWFSITLRERVVRIMDPFSADCIVAAVPTYYSEIRPKLDEVSHDVAKLRTGKDIAAQDRLETVERYKATLNELARQVENLSTYTPTLAEFSRKESDERQETRRFTMKWTVITAVIAAVTGGVVGAVLTKLLAKSP